MKSALLGCLVGGAIGDAVGGVVERGRLSLSDDTQLSLATCEALDGPGRPQPARVAERFVQWFTQRRLVGLGSSTAKALMDLEAGAHWASAGARGERAAGNGAAMRAAPLGFVLDPSDDLDRQSLRDLARITHHHDEAYVGALAVVLAVRHVLDEPRPRSSWLAALAEALPDSVTRDRLRVLTARPHDLPEAAALGSSGWTADTVPLALLGADAMLRDSFEPTLHRLVELSEDADTIPAIAGQVAGCALGLDALPDSLQESLPDRDEVLAIGRALAARLAPS
ncbi:MAG: ADP-ribosylglycohydrolase family protein [Acidobacteriota bacterium]